MNRPDSVTAAARFATACNGEGVPSGADKAGGGQGGCEVGLTDQQTTRVPRSGCSRGRRAR